MDEELPLVKKYNADMIGLLWGKEGMPRDANERCVLAVDLIYKAIQMGISNEDIWIDPIVTPGVRGSKPGESLCGIYEHARRYCSRV